LIGLLSFRCGNRHIDQYKERVRVMMFNTTFKNISAISCGSVLLLEETGVPGKNHLPAANI
jgi:hypothetical protein